MKVEQNKWGKIILTHLVTRNGFTEENELGENNGRSDSNFSHLVETNTAIDEQNGEEIVGNKIEFLDFIYRRRKRPSRTCYVLGLCWQDQRRKP